MTVQTVTLTVGTTCQYWLTPQAIQDITGLGVEAADIIQDWAPVDSSTGPVTIEFNLDDTFVWDIILTFKNAPPVIFNGYQPVSGDLLQTLAAQGWTPL